MHEWVALTPEQRAHARERYRHLKPLSPEKRDELRQRWHEYRELPEEQRQKLREERNAKGKPAG